MSKIYYKCIKKQYFFDGKIVDSTTDNYGVTSSIPYNQIITPAKYIYDHCMKSGFPVCYYWSLLSHFKIGQNVILDKIIQSIDNNNYQYRIQNIVSFVKDSSLITDTETLLDDCIDSKYTPINQMAFLSDGSMLWEYIAEQIRLSKFPDSLSRVKSYFLFSDKTQAQAYIDTVPNKQSCIIARAEPIDIQNIESYDMDIWNENHQNDNFDVVIDQYIRYWNSKNAQNKKIEEILFQGKLKLSI